MPRKAAGSGEQPKAPARAGTHGKRAWHIVGWERCYEPADDLRRGRKSPLPFVKLLTGAGDQGGREAEQIALQLKALRAEPDGLLHEAIWTRILCRAGSRANRRGWLLRFDDEPAAVRDIAMMIDAPPDQVRLSLDVLERLQFMERVPMPNGSPGPDGDDRPGKGRPAGPAKKPRKQAAKSPRKAKPKAPKKQPARRSRASAGAPRASARERRATASEGYNVNGERLRQRERLAPEPEPERLAPQPERPTAPAHGNGSNSARAKTATAKPGDGKDQTPQAPQPACRDDGQPSRAGADEPTTADPRGALSGDTDCQPTSSPRPTGSVSRHESAADPPAGARSPPASPEAPPPGAAVPIVGTPPGMAMRTYAEIYVSGSAVTRAFRARCSAGGADVPRDEAEFAVRERACFEAAWAAVLSLGLGAQDLLVLMGKASKEARRISRRSTPWRKGPGAAWRHWLNQHMESDAGVGRARWRRAAGGAAATARSAS